jgi:sec-independent protein translocase protein TatA
MFRNPLTDGLVVLVVLLLFFGPKRLPELGRGIGEGIKSFKDGIGGGGSSSEDDDKPQLSAQSETPATAPARDTVDAGAERSS